MLHAIRPQEWVPNFDPEKQKYTASIVWVQLKGLRLEYWTEKILLAMCKTLGKPIKVDEVTMNKEFGFFASVIVEIDFAHHVPDKIWVKSKWCPTGYYQEVVIPKARKFCDHCKILGHQIVECREALKIRDEAKVVDKSSEQTINNKKKRRGNRRKEGLSTDMEEAREQSDLEKYKEMAENIVQQEALKLMEEAAEKVVSQSPTRSRRFELLNNMDGVILQSENDGSESEEVSEGNGLESDERSEAMDEGDMALVIPSPHTQVFKQANLPLNVPLNSSTMIKAKKSSGKST